MGRWMIILLYMLMVYADQIKGVPETHGESLTDSQARPTPPAEKTLTAANPISKVRPQEPLCKCKGKGEVLVNIQCLCRQPVGFKRKSGKWRKLCQRKKFKDTKKCRRFRPRKTSISIPI